jgi:hypothetical protein
MAGDFVNEFFEEERHRCEVRQVLRWRAEDRTKAMDYLSHVRKRRGDSAADNLQSDCTNQWTKGNRGTEGDWR